MKSPFIWLQAQQHLLSPCTPVHLPLGFQSYWTWNTQASLTLKIITFHLYLFIRRTAHWEPLLCCPRALPQGIYLGNQGPWQGSSDCLPLCCNATALHQHLNFPVFQSRTSPFQKQIFSDSVTIHLFQSPILWGFYKATLEMSFHRALCCGVCAGAGSSLYLSKSPAVRPQILTPHLLHMKLCVLTWSLWAAWKEVLPSLLLHNPTTASHSPNASPPELLTGSGGERTKWGGREGNDNTHNHTHIGSPPRYIT